MADNTSGPGESTGGALGLLGVAFVVLKLTGHIDWSWWWVTAPFWAGLALFMVIMLGIAVAATVSHVADKRRARRG